MMYYTRLNPTVLHSGQDCIKRNFASFWRCISVSRPVHPVMKDFLFIWRTCAPFENVAQSIFHLNFPIFRPLKHNGDNKLQRLSVSLCDRRSQERERILSRNPGISGILLWHHESQLQHDRSTAQYDSKDSLFLD